MPEEKQSSYPRGLVVAIRADEEKQQAVYSFSRDGADLIDLPGPPLKKLEEFGETTQVMLAFSSQQSALMEVAAKFADPEMIPPEFVMNIPPDEGTLVIDPVCEHAADVPWALLPLALGLSDLTVVQIGKAARPHVPPKSGSLDAGPVEVLIVGCGGARYPAIARQLNEVKRRFGDRLSILTDSIPAGREDDPLEGWGGEKLLEKAANTNILHYAWPNAELLDPASRVQRAASLSGSVDRL
ncbi:MAG: hypothetical protein V3T83_12240, partial [Acidobacteriota bacterium]